MKYVIFILPFLLAIFEIIYASTTSRPALAQNRVVWLDVGQGDSALIESDGVRILIDTGGGVKTSFQLDSYLDNAFFKRKIDILVITHLHEDHYAGIFELVERYEISEIWINGSCSCDDLLEIQQICEFLNETFKNIHVVSSGYTSRFKYFAIDVLWPEKATVCENTVNNQSVVLEIAFHDKYRLIFMGDAERLVEDEVNNKLKADSQKPLTTVLKAGHHCSKTSSSEAFVREISPKIVICSVGINNSYGHPHKEVIQRFEDIGAEVILTSVEGDYVLNIPP